jgi:hypothetical protein
MTALRSGVRWLAPTSPASHATGVQVVAAVVRGREEMLREVEVKAGALSSAWPRRVRVVASL